MYPMPNLVLRFFLPSEGPQQLSVQLGKKGRTQALYIFNSRVRIFCVYETFNARSMHFITMFKPPPEPHEAVHQYV